MLIRASVYAATASLLLGLLTGRAIGAEYVSATVAPGDDWTLPSWVEASPNSGFVTIGTSDPILSSTRACEVQLPWYKVEPKDDYYDFSALKAALDSCPGQVIPRFFASDALHLPDWLKRKYPSIAPVRWRWPNQPYTDIVGWTGRQSPGDFYPVWDPRLEAEWRGVLQALGRTGYSKHPKFAFMYFPQGWRWGEYSVKWIPEMTRSGFTPEQYLAWFQRTTQDYINAVNGAASKLIFAESNGNREWIEWSGDSTSYNRWQQVINPNGENALTKYIVDRGAGARSGYTEVFNGNAAGVGWGTRLTTVGKYRYSIVDEDHPLISSTYRYFGTENEDLRYNWPNVNTYFYVKMTALNTLRLRMNHVYGVGDSSVGSDIHRYTRLVMGKHAYDSPDAWVALRQYRRAEIDKWQPTGADTAENIRNFERWLIQRDFDGSPGANTLPAARVNYPSEFASANGIGSYEALQTDPQTNNTMMYFAVDDHFMFGGPKRVQVKVTYLDNVPGFFTLEYNSITYTIHGTKRVYKTGDGKWKTATFTLAEAAFRNALPNGMDFRLWGGSTPLVVSFVRVVKLDPPSAKLTEAN